MLIQNPPTLVTKERLCKILADTHMQTDHLMAFLVLTHKSLDCYIYGKQQSILPPFVNTNSIFKTNTSQTGKNNKLTNRSVTAQTDILIKCDDRLSNLAGILKCPLITAFPV